MEKAKRKLDDKLVKIELTQSEIYLVCAALSNYGLDERAAEVVEYMTLKLNKKTKENENEDE